MSRTRTVIEFVKVGLGLFLLFFVFNDLDFVDFFGSVALNWHWGRIVLIGLAYAITVRFFEGYKGSLLECWLLVFYGACILSVVSWATLGTRVENADPLFGGGDSIVDFVPSHYERDQVGGGLFLDIFTPCLLGAYVSWRKNTGGPLGGIHGWLAYQFANRVLNSMGFVLMIIVWGGMVFGSAFATWGGVKLILDRGEIGLYLLWAVPFVLLFSSITFLLGILLPALGVRDARNWFRTRKLLRRSRRSGNTRLWP